MKPPTSRKEVRKFIGVVKYYLGILPRRSHTLAPLTKVTSNKRKFKGTKIKQDTFNEIKWIVAHDNLSTYPYFDGWFKIHIADIYFQLGAVISQKCKPVAFYSKNLLVPRNGVQ